VSTDSGQVMRVLGRYIEAAGTGDETARGIADAAKRAHTDPEFHEALARLLADQPCSPEALCAFRTWVSRTTYGAEPGSTTALADALLAAILLESSSLGSPNGRKLRDRAARLGVASVRRRRLGSELRRLREAHSFKLEDAADRLGLTASTLSRIETGRAPTRTAYLSTMFDIYGITNAGQRQALTDMARDGHRKGWWAVYDDVMPTGFDIYAGLEAEAAALRVFEDQVVHGLLQTEAYARIVMSAVRRQHSARQIDRAVVLRMQRQEALTRANPVKLWLILNEAVIRRTVGDAEVMHSQLTHLLKASQWPNVTLQVLPLSSGAHPALDGPFTILEFPERTDPDVVYTEGVAGQAYLERDSEVRACAEAFSMLQAAALSPADSAGLISWMARKSP
jgi:transcriptional regulator with XRE-family HTH domain